MIKTKHLYIHLPITNSNCLICDIDKSNLNLKNIIDKFNDERLDNHLKSLYIGGLNPGSLAIKDLILLFKAIWKRFKTIKELSFETYAESVSNEKIKIWKNNKVNRIVLKAKTTNRDLLNLWNMKNCLDTTFKQLRMSGFKNISIDMNFGFNLNILKQDIDLVLKLQPESIHWYSHEMHGSIKDFKLINKLMVKNSYQRYELTGFSKKGYDSIHSLAYWQSCNWIGIGDGAYSFFDGVYNNVLLNEKELCQHIIIMSLQCKYGLNLQNKKHLKSYKYFQKEIDSAIKDKILTKNRDSIYFNKDKWEMLDEVLKNIL